MEWNCKINKMNFIVILLLLLLNFGTSDETSTQRNSSCENDVCLKEENNETETALEVEVTESMIHNVLYKNSSEVHDFEDDKMQIEMPEDKSQKDYSEGSLSALELQSDNATEQYEEITFTHLITEDAGLSTKQSSENIPQTVPTTMPKLNISTTSKPHYGVTPSRTKGICLCDFTVNECDINCCCDEDCTSFHFKVFTKCKDIQPEFDSKYCFQNNFIFENHTLYKIVQKTGGLFCIVRDNLPVSSGYDTKHLITTKEEFNKNMPEKLYRFSYKSLRQFQFSNKGYEAGSVVWIVQNGELKPFRIPIPTLGHLCASQGNIRYLMDDISLCYNKYQLKANCGNSRRADVFNFLKDIKVISNPAEFNKSTAFDSSKNCKAKTCIGMVFYLCQYIDKVPTCIKIENSNFPPVSCWGTVSNIKYQIWHNGSKGITTFEAYIWLKNFSEDPNESLIQLRTEVKYLWVGTKNIFHKSGNPGYITGKPILAGRKVYNSLNGSAEKKEAIELSLNPEDWLNVLGSEKGICSSKMRIPIKFRENGQYICSLKLTKDYFQKDKCTELQNYIFKLLTETDVTNMTRENFLNKFVATFGNSKVEETGDWVQVLIEAISSQAVFKSNNFQLICKNIVTDLSISIVYSNIGSFSQSQSKILGISMHFGKHKDLIFNCDNPSCDSAYHTQKFKLTTLVQFIDVTKPAFDAFAEPLTLETRLPHDFFYPFFSRGSKSKILSELSLILILSIFV